MSSGAKIEKLFSILLEEINKNKALKEKIESIFNEPDADTRMNNNKEANIDKSLPKPSELLKETEQSSSKEDTDILTEQRKKKRREHAVLDPVKLIEEDKALLKTKLEELDFEKLRDIIAEYGMDPAKLAMKWKNKERIIEHILMTAESRSKKGDAFR